VSNTVSSKAMSDKTVSSESVSNETVSSKTVSSDETVSSKSVSDKAVSSVDNGSSVGNGVVGNGVGNSVDKRGGMGNSVVGNRDSLRVGSSSGVGNLRYIAINVVGVVVDGLDAAVGKVHLVGALNNTGAIVALGLAEGSARVLVSHSVVVGVGGDLSKVGGSIADSMVGNRGSVDGMVDNRGMVDHRGGMDQGCGMGHSMAKTVSDNAVGKTVSDNTVGETVSDNRGGMDKRGSVGNAVTHYSVTNKTVASKTMPNHSRGPEDLRGRRGGGCKGCQSNEGLHPG